MRLADVEVDVEDVLARLGVEPVSRREGGWADALCPFHEERRASFSVSLEHGGWVDRHTARTGSLLALVAELRGMSRDEAARWVRGSRTIIESADLLARILRSGAPRDAEAAALGEDVRRWAARFEALPTDRMSEYFFERGFTDATRRRFDVRYDDDPPALVWPVRDENANLAGFALRKVPPCGWPPYLYPRGFRRMLFPLDAYEGETVVLVEGPLDAMRLHQAGVSGALALLGADLTDAQLATLRRLARRVVLALDSDPAGDAATATLTRRLVGTFDLWRVRWPAGAKDAGEVRDDGSLLAALAGAERWPWSSAIRGGFP